MHQSLTPTDPDEQNLKMLNNFIKKSSCVLMLGPLFGRDAQGNKIHIELKKYLTSPPNNLVLDDEFDNLYISKKSDRKQNAAIISGITSFYDNINRNEVYDKLLNVGFQAIISFSSDLLFYSANQSKQEYDFFSFNRKGSENEFENDSEKETQDAISKKPLIYNIFGNMEDLNAMIVDYDSLYDFLLNMIKAEKQIPLRLKNILGKSTAFLFLGFDLSRWYIPIIIRKLNQFIINNGSGGVVTGFVCLDDTPMVSPEIIQDSLNRYPLIFQEFKNLGTIDLINRLAIRQRNMHPVTRTTENLPPTKEQLAFFKKWHEEFMHAPIDETSLNNFFQEYIQINYKGAHNKSFLGLRMQFNGIMLDKHKGVIKIEDFNVQKNIILNSLFDLIKELISTY